MGDCQERKLTDVIENLPAHSRDFSRELAGRILSGKISRNADFSVLSAVHMV